jgi:hypothetical protein
MDENKSQNSPTPSTSHTSPSQNPDSKYVNMVRIVHSHSEFVFDFTHVMPGESKGKLQSRIIMFPLSAKLFHRALTENLANYEATFGEIQIPGESTLADKLFRKDNGE